jgi:translation initiation factor 1 (eIF-1/SUI1)
MSRDRDADRLVYSSTRGRIRPSDPEPPRRARGDGIVRVRRETQGRGGKTVTTISGVPLADDALAGRLLRSSVAASRAGRSMAGSRPA